MNTLYTLVHKSVVCPKWHEKITVTAKYRYTDNFNKAVFAFAECEILKNLKLPRDKRNHKLDIFAYCDRESTCPCLKDFPEHLESL